MNQDTIDINKKWESLHDGDLTKIGLQPKMDSIGIWTEGWGNAMINPNTGDFLRGIENKELANKLATIHTEEQANIALNIDLIRYAKMAEIAVGVDYWKLMNENMKGALTTFVRNCGTINKKAKKPYQIFRNIQLFFMGNMSQQQLVDYWKKSVITAGGVKLRGLELRRADEVKLFFK